MPSTLCSIELAALHLPAFLGAVAEAGDRAGLPHFVEREFREFLMYGLFEGGVARRRAGAGVRAAEYDCGVTDRERGCRDILGVPIDTHSCFE